MGVVLSYFRGSNGSNEPDPVTGLTPREKNLVTSSWNLVKKDLQGNGIQLFMMFFGRKPEYQNYFSFRDIPLDELPTSPKLKAHGLTVMYGIASLIDNLDSPDVLITLLKKTGESHAARKIPPETFDVLKSTILELLEKGLGPKITKEGLEAWNKTLTVAFKVIVDTLKIGAKNLNK